MFVFDMVSPAKLASNQLSRIMSYPAALYMPPPSVAMLRSKTQLVVLAGPDTSGSFLLHVDPVEKSAKPDSPIENHTDRWQAMTDRTMAFMPLRKEGTGLDVNRENNTKVCVFLAHASM